MEAHDYYFRQMPIEVGLLGAIALKKVVGSFRILVDEVVRIVESIIIEAFQHFVQVAIEIFSEKYLRPLTTEDTTSLMEISNMMGWPCMLGCINCMYWEFPNYMERDCR